MSECSKINFMHSITLPPGCFPQAPDITGAVASPLATFYLQFAQLHSDCLSKGMIPPFQKTGDPKDFLLGKGLKRNGHLE